MHFTKAFALLSALLTLGLATPTPQDLEQREVYHAGKANNDMLYTRDVQAANAMLIQDTIAKTGYDVHSKQNITKEDIAKLSPDDAQILAVELNKFAVNHDRADLVVPAFDNKQFSAAAADVKNKAAAKAQANAERSELVVFDDQGADAGALVEAREAQILNFFLHLVGLAIYAIIVLF